MGHGKKGTVEDAYSKPIIEESEHDILKESPNPCLF